MSLRAWAGFFGLSVLWGVPYLFIKVAVDDGVPPLFLSWVRVTMAAVILLALAARAGSVGQLRGLGRRVALYATLEVCLPFPLIAFGEGRVTSSLAAILVATVPAWIALLSLRVIPSERLTRTRGLGLAIGFGGVVALVGIDSTSLRSEAGDGGELLGAAAILLACVGYAAGPLIYQRTFSAFDSRAAMGWAMAAAAVILAPFAVLDTPERLTDDAALAIVVLGTACTAAAFSLFAWLISEIGAARTAILTYVAPVVAVVAGVLVLDEDVGPGALAGLVLILAGSYLATRPSKAEGAPDDLAHDLVGAAADRP